MLVDIAAAIAFAGDPPGATISETASAVVGHPVQVLCDTPPPWYGHVIFHGPPWVPEATIHLRPDICEALEEIRNAPLDKYMPSMSGLALHVLAHEAAHATGIMDETLADCTAPTFYERAAALLSGWGAEVGNWVSAARFYGRTC